MLRLVTAGESHGKCLTGILEGLPSGLEIEVKFIDGELHRRQLGFGRGARMRIERDRIEITAGVRHGKTLGSPIAFTIHNRDWENWQIPMSTIAVPEGADLRSVTRPRPGHADLAGALKHQTHDARDILERASARETAARVAVGSFCRLLLQAFGLQVASHVLAIGNARVPESFEDLDLEAIRAIDPESALRCADAETEKEMMDQIREYAKSGDTLGGVAEIVAAPVPPGLGSHTQWDRKLDGRIARGLMSIPAVKAVELGRGIEGARRPGSCLHDEISYDEETRSFGHATNHAGGLEGGVTNGEPLRARIFVKPIPTLRKSLKSVDLVTKEPSEAAFERSDVCVVPAAGVVGEAMLAIVLAEAFLEKFGGDSMNEMQSNYRNYCQLLRTY
jgi:chorismate synthase